MMTQLNEFINKYPDIDIDQLIRTPDPAGVDESFTVVPLGSASEATKTFVGEFGPNFKLLLRAFSPKTNRYVLFLSSCSASVAKYVPEDDVILVANYNI